MKGIPENSHDNIVFDIEHRFISRTLLSTSVVTLIIFLYSLHIDWRWGVTYAVISVLTALNFLVFYYIFTLLLFQRSKGYIVVLVFFKLFAIYGSGILFLYFWGFHLSAFLAGINTLFIVILLRMIGSQLFTKQKV